MCGHELPEPAQAVEEPDDGEDRDGEEEAGEDVEFHCKPRDSRQSGGMTHGEQIDAFTGEIERVILRFRQEFNLPLASAVGALEIVKFDLMHECTEPDKEEGEPTSFS